MKLMEGVLEKEKQFVKKYGFNMNEKQVRLAITHLATDTDEMELPYW